jgi:hypothetical protein
LLAYPAFSLGVDQLWPSKGTAKVGVTVGLCTKGRPQADADSDDWMHLKILLAHPTAVSLSQHRYCISAEYI